MSLPGKRRLVPQSPCQAAFCPGSGSARFRMRDQTAAAASRVAQEAFDKYFPTERTEDLKLIVTYDQNTDDAAAAADDAAN